MGQPRQALVARLDALERYVQCSWLACGQAMAIFSAGNINAHAKSAAAAPHGAVARFSRRRLWPWWTKARNVAAQFPRVDQRARPGISPAAVGVVSASAASQPASQQRFIDCCAESLPAVVWLESGGAWHRHTGASCHKRAAVQTVTAVMHRRSLGRGTSWRPLTQAAACRTVGALNELDFVAIRVGDKCNDRAAAHDRTRFTGDITPRCLDLAASGISVWHP